MSQQTNTSTAPDNRPLAEAPKLAIIVPCFNEQETLTNTIATLLNLYQQLIDKNLIANSSELVFIDDGSQDQSWSIIEQSAAEHQAIKGIKLANNSGHQNALLAGLLSIDSDVYISLDADLQDDIQVIEGMLRQHQQGYQIVYGVRKNRQSDSWLKRKTAQGYYRFAKLMGVNIIYNHADFRLMSQQAVRALSEYQEINIFLRGLIPSIGFSSSTIEYDRQARQAGESKYSWRKMLSLGLNGITSHSAMPLRFVAIMGFLIFIFTALISLWALWVKFVNQSAIPGWTSSVLPMYLLGGIQLLSLGILGEYIGKIYIETKKRPRFIIEKTLS